MTIGELIKEYRLNRDWTMTQLAEEAEVSQTTISLLERDKRYPSDEVLHRIYKVLEIPNKKITEAIMKETGNEEKVNVNNKDRRSQKLMKSLTVKHKYMDIVVSVELKPNERLKSIEDPAEQKAWEALYNIGARKGFKKFMDNNRKYLMKEINNEIKNTINNIFFDEDNTEDDNENIDDN